MKLVMMTTPAEDFFEKRSKFIVAYNSRSRDPEHIRHITIVQKVEKTAV